MTLLLLVLLCISLIVNVDLAARLAAKRRRINILIDQLIPPVEEGEVSP